MKPITIEPSIEERLREQRQKCFNIINRGKLWYDTLSMEQLTELKKWYFDWLNVTETKIVPKEPEWLKNKIKEEEILY